MSLELLFAALIPLVLYVVVEIKKGQKAATITAMASGLALAGYLFWRFDALDETYIVELVLILIMGGVSLKMHESKWFKFQPMVTGIIFASYGFYLQFFATPLFLKMGPMLEKMSQSQHVAMLNSPDARELLASMSWETSFLILLHAGACGYAAKKFTSLNWLLTRLAIYPIFMVYFLVRWVPFVMAHMSLQ